MSYSSASVKDAKECITQKLESEPKYDTNNGSNKTKAIFMRISLFLNTNIILEILYECACLWREGMCVCEGETNT